MADFSAKDQVMHDGVHPCRLESRDYLEQLEVMKIGRWYDGIVIETAKEEIYFLLD